ncbi:MAG TPA: DNA-formamidopyrimidine glycosylase [Anaerolineae bacterium]|jgi:formamidopyrimidine-DNA glycosylase
MPELPEVETIARQLRDGRVGGIPSLIGRTIIKTQVNWAREVGPMPAKTFEKRTRGCRVTSVGRHGKWLIIELTPVSSLQPQITSSPSSYMLVHLRMSGRLEVVAQAEANTKHARVVWLLDEGWALRFDDARKFGRVALVDDPARIISRTGPDALAISAEDFTQRLLAKRGALKPLLLNQAFIAGVGNIYADESLHLAKLHPLRTAQGLTRKEALRLHAAIQQVLLAGVSANGASFDWVYPGGNYQETFRVYGRTGEPCPICGTPITRIIVGQRSTHVCAVCQRLEIGD